MIDKVTNQCDTKSPNCLLIRLGMESDLVDTRCSECGQSCVELEQFANEIGKNLALRNSKVEQGSKLVAQKLRSVLPNQPEDASSKENVPAPKMLGTYRIVREIGRGGMGIVYEAEQVTLGRRVALKILPNTVFREANSAIRFQKEAQAAGSLHHTNIVPVIESGQDQGTFFYAMHLIKGRGLDVIRDEIRESRSQAKISTIHAARVTLNESNGNQEVSSEEIASNGRQDDLSMAEPQGSESSLRKSKTNPGFSFQTPSSHFEFVADVGRQTASALHYAHERGIIHRDVKPSNLILDGDGVVWLADFGLAKQLDDDLTATAQTPGTLRYMSPERFKGQVDPTSDVYSLGTVLYELLTLQSAFSANDQLSLLEQIKNKEPQLPRSLDRQVPWDLQTIVMKAMAKAPASRYPSAQAMQDDLESFLDSRPISARRVSAFERLWLWVKKEKSLAAALATVALLLVAGTIGSLFAANHQSKLASEKTQLAEEKTKLATEKITESKQAKAQRNLAYRNAYFADMRQSQQDWKNGNVRQLLATLREYLPKADFPDVRGWEWYYLLSLAHQDKVTMLDHEGTVMQLDWSTDGERLFSMGNEGAVRIWNRDGQLIRKIAIPGIQAFDLNPDSTQFVTVCGDETFRFFDVETGKLVRTFRNKLVLDTDVQWSEDGSHVVARQQKTDSNGKDVFDTVVLDLDKEKIIAEMYSPPATVMKLSPFSPEQPLVLIGRWGGLYIHDWRTAKHVCWYNSYDFQPKCAAWHPDGRRFAVGAYLQGVRLFEMDEGSEEPKLLAHLHNGSSIDALAFSPDGKQLYLGNRGQRIEIYDLEAQESVRTLKGHMAAIRSIAVHPDNQRIATSSDDGSIKIWDLTEPSEQLAQRSNAPEYKLNGVSDDGRFRWEVDGRWTTISDPQTGQQIAKLAMAGRFKAKFFPEVDRAIFWLGGSATGHFYAWDTKTWQPVTNSANGYQPSLDVCGDFAVLTAWTGYIHRFNSRTGEIKILKPQNTLSHLTRVSISPDTRTFVTAVDGQVKLWDMVTCEEIASFYGHRPGGFISKLTWGNSGKVFRDDWRRSNRENLGRRRKETASHFLLAGHHHQWRVWVLCR